MPFRVIGFHGTSIGVCITTGEVKRLPLAAPEINYSEILRENLEFRFSVVYELVHDTVNQPFSTESQGICHLEHQHDG
jgi:hypothetical protein